MSDRKHLLLLGSTIVPCTAVVIVRTGEGISEQDLSDLRVVERIVGLADIEWTDPDDIPQPVNCVDAEGVEEVEDCEEIGDDRPADVLVRRDADGQVVVERSEG
jgi:hypothetical protein